MEIIILSLNILIALNAKRLWKMVFSMTTSVENAMMQNIPVAMEEAVEENNL